MHLLRVGPVGRERPAVLTADHDGEQILDLSSLVEDIGPDTLSPANLARLRTMVEDHRGTLPQLDRSGLRIGPPVTRVGKIVCIGLNYRQHAAEAGMAVPEEPVLFMKAPDTIGGPNDPVTIPLGSKKTDYEVELAVVIGRKAAYIPDSQSALDYIAGYCISNDVSEREFQLERGGQWDKGKNAATFNPLGPYLVTTDTITDPQNLSLSTRVNGELRQDSSTADMIFSVDFLVRYVSQFMTLYPGDVINTGTPQGVGSGYSPGRFLDHGDTVTVSIEGLGAQSHVFNAHPGVAS